MNKQSTITLCIIAALVTGCNNEDKEQDLYRQSYKSNDDCKKDWGEMGCEEDKKSNGGGGIYRGPFYSSNGTIYHYDGRETSLVPNKQMSGTTESFRGSPSGIYANPSGAYTRSTISSVNHGNAARSGFSARASAMSRAGGFGSTGGHGSSGG